MPESVLRILVLLAGARIPSQMVAEFIRYVQRIDPDALARDYRRLKSRVGKLEMASDHDDVMPTMFSPRASASLRREINEMLRIGTGLTVRAAANELADKLIQIGALTPSEMPPFQPKEGFSAWVRELTSLVEPSEMLKAAALVSAQHRGKKTTAWPLKDHG